MKRSNEIRFSTHGPPYNVSYKLKFCKTTNISELRLERSISKEVLVTGPKFQAKFPSSSGVCLKGGRQLNTLSQRTKEHWYH